MAEGGAPAAAKAETAAEKLARLRAKQAARMGGAYLNSRIGGDYATASGTSAKATVRPDSNSILIRFGVNWVKLACDRPWAPRRSAKAAKVDFTTG